jgi:hypothetical protein
MNWKHAISEIRLVILQRVPLAAMIIVLLCPQFVLANWKDFIPVPYENGAEIRGFASYEHDDNEIGDNRNNWEDVFFREKFLFHSRGFSYDPRFIQYYLSLGAALKQENYSSTFLRDLGWQHDNGLEYDFRVYVLPEHAYNLELFTMRLEPLFKEHTATQHDNVEKSRGAIFRYKKKPYFLTSKYIEDEITSGFNESDVHTFDSLGTYFKDLGEGKVFSLSGNYRHQNFTNSSGLEGNSDQGVLAGNIRNRWISLDSSVSKGDLDQHSRVSDHLSSDQFSWLELLTADLPAGFSTHAQYRYFDNSNTSVIGSAEGRTISSIRREAQVVFTHQLYESLTSNYTYRHDSASTTGGDSTSFSHFGNLDYIRRTKWGPLQAGAYAGRSVTESAGQTSIVNESHTGTPVPGSFVLNETQQIERRSLEVLMRNPLPPNELIPLQENVHYTVTPEGTTFRVNIFNLPPQFLVPDTYDFLVTYNLTSGEFELQTDTYGYRLSFDLFYTLEPYYSYGTSRPEEESGEFPGFLFPSTTWTAGLVFHRDGFRMLGEYQKFDWKISPYESWRAEARYTGSLSPTLRWNAAAEYLNRYYPNGSYLEAARAYREKRATASSSIQKEMFRRSLLFSLGGSYSHFLGFNEGNAYSINSTLSWHIAKLDFTLGANMYHNDSEGPFTVDQRRTHQYYYLNVGRKLF